MNSYFVKTSSCCLVLSCFFFMPLNADELQDEVIFAEGAISVSKEKLLSFPTTAEHRAYLPVVADLTRFFPSPGNQGEQSSCVGWSVGYAARAYYSAALEGKKRNSKDSIPSPAFIYNSIKDLPGDCDEGTSIPDALNFLRKGSLSLAQYPYSSKRCRRPSAAQSASVSDFKIRNWRRVDHDNLDQIKAELAKKHPVIISIKTNKDFHKLRGKRIWNAGPTDLGGSGHAVTLVGYSEQKQSFKFINSWGRRWGDRGFGRMTYDTFQNRARSAYTMRMFNDVPNPPQPVPPEPKPSPFQITDVKCGKVLVRELNGKKIASGFVGSEKDLKLVKSQLSGKVDEIIVNIRPWPQCETLLTLNLPLEMQEKPVIKLSSTKFEEDGPFIFDVTMPAFNGYLHVAYVQADGNVVNLVQSTPLNLKTLNAGEKIRFGDGSDGFPEFFASKPFGDEMIVAIASKSPLFSDDRDVVEKERSFLTALRKAIIAKPEKTPLNRAVTAQYATFKTMQKETK